MAQLSFQERGCSFGSDVEPLHFGVGDGGDGDDGDDGEHGEDDDDPSLFFLWCT